MISVAAKNLFDECGEQSGICTLLCRKGKAFNMNNDTGKALTDLKDAAKLDKNEWRYGRELVNYYSPMHVDSP